MANGLLSKEILPGPKPDYFEKDGRTIWTRPVPSPTQKVFELLNISTEEDRQRVGTVLDGFSTLESDHEDKPNPKSSARGYFQYMVGNGCSEFATNAEGASYCPKENKGTLDNPVFKNSSFNTALNRVDNFFRDQKLGPVPEAFKEARRAKTPMDILTYEQQKLLNLLDSYMDPKRRPLLKQSSLGGAIGKEGFRNFYGRHVGDPTQIKKIGKKLNKTVLEIYGSK